jgi:hypothetical protein
MEARVYTHGTWVVEPSAADELTRRWLALGDWTRDRFGAAGGVLLRDRDDERHYVSIVPWRSFEQIAERRAAPQFQEQVAELMRVVSAHDARALDVVARW